MVLFLLFAEVGQSEKRKREGREQKQCCQGSWETEQNTSNRLQERRREEEGLVMVMMVMVVEVVGVEEVMGGDGGVEMCLSR